MCHQESVLATASKGVASTIPIAFICQSQIGKFGQCHRSDQKRRQRALQTIAATVLTPRHPGKSPSQQDSWMKPGPRHAWLKTAKSILQTEIEMQSRRPMRSNPGGPSTKQADRPSRGSDSPGPPRCRPIHDPTPGQECSRRGDLGHPRCRVGTIPAGALLLRGICPNPRCNLSPRRLGDNHARSRFKIQLAPPTPSVSRLSPQSQADFLFKRALRSFPA